MQKENIVHPVGAVLKEKSTNLFGIVYAMDSDGDYKVIDSDGDRNTFMQDDIEVYSIEQLIREKNVIILPSITDMYNGVLNFNDRKLYVGCQAIPFEKVQEIAALCK